MKPETGRYLVKAHALLKQGRAVAAIDQPEAAGRAAYLSGFHAAQALIFEREDRALKTHRGVHSEFARLAKDDNRFDSELRVFLGHAYDLKSVADYETGADAHVSEAQAAHAIAEAQRFIAAVEGAIGR